MGTAVNLLRRRVPPVISGSLFRHIPVRNPKPVTSPNPFSTGPPFCTTISFRSFSWYSWTAGPKADDGSDGFGEGLIHVDDPGAGVELLGSGLDGAVVLEASGGDTSWYRYPVHAVVSLLDGFHDFSGLPW